MASSQTKRRSRSPQVPLVIAPVRLRELPQLVQLFEQATKQHFGYFPPHIQHQIISGHSLFKLLKARFDDKRVVLVARSGNNIVGYCIGALPKTGPAQLFWLYVEPNHRGTNTGLSLLSRTIKHLAEAGAGTIFLATYDHRRYYERQGFTWIGRDHRDGIEVDIMSYTVRRHV
ncbi:GNAT family N-acetyltransferase [bacterium]|nr:MAG: GNAT family N-acetyltransferase [bacterium]